MRGLIAVALAALVVVGCTTVARTGYETATDERSLATQTADTKIAATIKKNLLESSVKGTGGLDVFCRNGSVVVAGVVERGSQAGSEAVAIARRVDGVKRVDTYFVPDQPSSVSDFTIKQKIGAKLVGDGDLKAGQVDMSVVAGHVVLVGVVSSKAKVDKIVAHARSTDGVVAVKSFIQIGGQ
ncbi:MAG: BON domain-containing protein [Candidatus Rokuibacteriota bacterium]